MAAEGKREEAGVLLKMFPWEVGTSYLKFYFFFLLEKNWRDDLPCICLSLVLTMGYD